MLKSIAALALCLSASAAPIIYTRTLTTADPYSAVGTHEWDDGGFQITSTVSVFEDHAIYEYSIEAYRKGVSHLIVSLSNNCASDPGCVQDATSEYEVGLWHHSQPANQGIPMPVFGVKFEATGLTAYSVSFRSNRAPMNGDFFAKDGTSGPDHTDVYAYNAALNYWPDGCGAGSFLITPDTRYVSDVVTPEPATYALIGGGLLLIAFRRNG